MQLGPLDLPLWLAFLSGRHGTYSFQALTHHPHPKVSTVAGPIQLQVGLFKAGRCKLLAAPVNCVVRPVSIAFHDDGAPAAFAW